MGRFRIINTMVRIMRVSISKSTTDVTKYEWFTYFGPAKEFADHNPKFHLSLEKNDIFGVRKVGNKNKVVDASAVDTEFTLSDVELKRVVAKSSGYKGKVSRVAVRAGVGGLDKPKVKPAVGGKIPRIHTVSDDKDDDEPKKVPVTVNAPKPKDTPSGVKPSTPTRITRIHTPANQDENEDKGSVYPDVNFPVTREELQRLFKLLNTKYFDGILNPNTPVTITAGFKKLGMAKTTWRGNKIVNQSILMNRGSILGKQRLVNTLIHEMIHLEHAVYRIEQGKQEYDEGHIRNGHGPKFVARAREFNAKGFAVEDYQAEILSDSVDVTLYALFAYSTDSFTCVYHTKPFKHKIAELLQRLKTIFGELRYTHYIYGETNDPIVTRHPKLAAGFTISPRMKSNHGGYMNPRVQKAIDELNFPVKGMFSQTQAHQESGVSPLIVSLIPRLTKIRVLPLATFLTMCMRHCGISEYIQAERDSPNMRIAIEKLSTADREYLHKYWLETPDVLLTSQKVYKKWIDSLAREAETLLYIYRVPRSTSFEEENSAGIKMQFLVRILYGEIYPEFRDRRTVDEMFALLSKSLAKKKMNSPQVIFDVLKLIRNRFNERLQNDASR